MLRSTWKRGRTLVSCAMRASCLRPCSTAEIERCSLFTMKIDCFMEPPRSQLRSYDLRIRCALARGAQIAVEDHADRAHQQPSFRRHHDPVGLELDQALAGEPPQIPELLGEVLVEVDEVRELDRLYRDAELA